MATTPVFSSTMLANMPAHRDAIGVAVEAHIAQHLVLIKYLLSDGSSDTLILTMMSTIFLLHALSDAVGGTRPPMPAAMRRILQRTPVIRDADRDGMNGGESHVWFNIEIHFLYPFLYMAGPIDEERKKYRAFRLPVAVMFALHTRLMDLERCGQLKDWASDAPKGSA